MSMGYIDIFRYKSYKKYTKDRIFEMPHNGKGQFRKLGAAAGMHSSLVSQVFNGERNLSPEQACLVSEFLGLAQSEQEYFSLLVQRERAGSKELIKLTDSMLLRLKVQTISDRGEQGRSTAQKTEVSEESKAIFYSQWYYSATRLLTLLPGGQTVDAISDRLRISSKIVREVVEFLVKQGFCEIRKERIYGKVGVTHVGSDSQHLDRHLQNWRLKGIERLSFTQEGDIASTYTLALSAANVERVRRAIRDALKEMQAAAEVDDVPEHISFMNIDWIEL